MLKYVHGYFQTIAGAADIEEAIQDVAEPEDNVDEEEALRNEGMHDFDYDEQGDADEASHFIPKDLDGWCWAFSDSECEAEDSHEEKKEELHSQDAVAHRVRVAEQREEYIQCKADGLLSRPAGSTLGVHPASRTWRSSYCGSKHYGRTWGTNRSPRKALLEVVKLILEDHVNLNKGDKIAKGQLARVTKAWNEA